MSELWPQVSTELPGPKSQAYFDRMDKVAAAPLQDHDEVPFVEARKIGHLIEDVDGNLFSDLVSAWGASPYGTPPPGVTEAVVDAQRRYGMEITDYVQNDLAIELAEKLVGIAPPGISRVTVSLSGTLAVEAGVKLARESTGRPMILVFHGQYHGEVTYLTASVSTDLAEVNSSNSAYVGGLVFAPYPQQFRAPFHRGAGPYDDTLYMDFIEEWLLVHQVEPQQIAGVLIEPVLGSGGVVVPPDTFWPALTALCDEHGWLLCLDEVKTGFGRTGAMFAADLWGLRPDLMCLGKAMGGGVMPIGAVLGTERALGGYDDLSTGSTWSWLPASCAASLAYLDLLEREDVLGNVRALHEVAAHRLTPLVGTMAEVGDVRVQGAFVAVELVHDPITKERAPDLQERVARGCLRRGVLVDSSTTSLNIQPSLTMAPAAYDEALGRVVAAIEEALR